MKILIVKTSSMGDVVHALPVLADIKSTFADCQIDWLVEEPFADIVRASPLVDHIFLSNIRKWRKAPLTRDTLHEFLSLRDELKSAKYDLAIDLQGLFKSAFLAKLASSPISGYDFTSAREGGASCFYNKKYKVDKQKPAIARCRELAAQALNYPLPNNEPVFNFANIQNSVSSESSETIEKEKLGNFLEKTAIFFVNASRTTKLWPENSWIQLGKSLVQQNFKILLPWGSQEDLERVVHIKEGIGELAEVQDHLTIGQIMSQIAISNLIVGVDTGLTHLSSAMGIPTVAIFLDYPIELVPLAGKGKKKALGGTYSCPSWKEVSNTISEILK